MTAELESSLGKIASLSKTLNEASDQLSKQIAEIESALNAYALGIWAWIKHPLAFEHLEHDAEHCPACEGEAMADRDGIADAIHYVRRLGYGKHNGKWGLLVAAGVDEDWPNNIEIAFLCDAPREIRLKAIDKMPELLEDLAQQLAKITEEASKKAAQAKEIASALRQKRS